MIIESEKIKFLMYRVELKDRFQAFKEALGKRFLMYRVELKGSIKTLKELLAQWFLMYRVELKESFLHG